MHSSHDHSACIVGRIDQQLRLKLLPCTVRLNLHSHKLAANLSLNKSHFVFQILSSIVLIVISKVLIKVCIKIALHVLELADPFDS